MTETERTKVGHALDLLRDSLAEYVDSAMTTAYGPQWNERVAEEDAKRRSNGRMFQVSKGDLAVMLKVIQHERVAPWSNSRTNSDPRIRSFASEILTLRNLFSHGDECLDEHARLLDTASRFLTLLGLPVPGELQTPHDTQRDESSPVQIAATSEPFPTLNAVFVEELKRLGESGDDFTQLMSRVGTVQKVVYRIALESYEPDPGSLEAELVERDLPGLQNYTLDTSVGSEVLQIVEELQRLEATAAQHDSNLLRVLVMYIRCTLLDWPGGIAALSYAFHEIDWNSPAASGKLEMVTGLMNLVGVTGWRELTGLAAKLTDRSTSNVMILAGNAGVLNDPTTSDEEALTLVRDSIPRIRMFAGMAPGADYETLLVRALRREGRLCNDLGRTEEATQAFARADEIIDRYPAADPDLTQ